MRSRLALLILLPSVVAAAPTLRLQLPLGRTAYQTNEAIDLAVIRGDDRPLPVGGLRLVVTPEADAAPLTFTFALPGGPSPRADYLRLDGRCLRPGRYQVAATTLGQTATQTISLHSHLRQTTYRLIDWGSRAPADRCAVLGEDSLGFNLLYAAAPGDASVRGGLDFTGCCVMSGGHQMDLRMACDWSDPNVLAGGRARAVRAALQWRTSPNLLGIHCYDEPGLTWGPDPRGGGNTPHAVAAQHEAWRAAFGTDPPDFHDLANPAQAERWRQWARWKEGFMEAAWRDTQAAISAVRPSLLTLTQSQYAFTAFTDGYYFNVTRGLPVASGHGGYDDMGPGYFCPSYYLEMARARDLSRPCWYLPTWYGSTLPEAYRLEMYLSFVTGIQGLAKPPDMQVHDPAKTPQTAEIVEVNRTAARLGTIFGTMPPRRPEVAVLYSLSHLIGQQIKDPTMCYAHNDPHGVNLAYVYFATKMIQQPIQAVVEEDILDGTLAATSRAVILPAITSFDPAVVRALEAFAARGGLVLTTAGTTVAIKGAVDLGVTPRLPEQDQVDALIRAQKWAELRPYTTVAKQFQAARPLAAALRRRLAEAGIAPAFECDSEGIVAARQGAGDIEYLFAVNASPQPDSPANVPVAATARITLPAAGRAVYDALLGGRAEAGATLRFGPGQMRAWALTARPINGVRLGEPTITWDTTGPDAPRRVSLGAALVDDRGEVLAGSAPLRVRLLDPRGVTRYDLYRATEAGWLRLDLPLALNDPPGTWTAEVQDLLSTRVARRDFDLPAVGACGAAAGLVRRALLLDEDREHIRALAQDQRRVLVAVGSGPACQAAGQRLVASLAPWKVQAQVVPAADLNRPRALSEAEALTFCGLDYAAQGQIKPGQANSPLLVGFDVDRPVLLVGTPADNPLLAALVHHKVLPYAPSADLPGPGRGLVAWQRDIIGQGIESVALVGSDADGLAEAVGTFHEAVAGLAPLTPLALPESAEVGAPSPTVSLHHEPRVVWSTTLPDKPARLRLDGDTVVAFMPTGQSARVNAAGRVLSLRPAALPPATRVSAGPQLADHLVKASATTGGLTATAWWGGRLRVADAQGRLVAERRLPNDITDLLWLGGRLIVGLADGRLLALAP